MGPDPIYEKRFPAAEVQRQAAIWRVLGRYLQRYVPEGASVLDIGADRGQFIKNITARERYAADVRDMAAEYPRDVRFVQGDGLKLAEVLPTDHFDRIFMSNYLEHLPSSDAVIRQFQVVRELLIPGGRVIVLQPNIRLTGPAYWDFIDHKVALTERSLVEAAEIAGLERRLLIQRFLPYTTKSRLPQSPVLVRAYLNFRPAWWLLGKQTLLIAERPL